MVIYYGIYCGSTVIMYTLHIIIFTGFIQFFSIRCSFLKVLIVVCEFQLCILIANAQAPDESSQYWYHSCSHMTTYNPNSTYQLNLNRFLTNVSSTNNLYLNATVGNNAPDVAVYGMGLCRGGISIDACRQCLGLASSEIIQRCPNEKESIIWYEQCRIRYSDIYFFGTMDTFPGFSMFNQYNASDPERFDKLLGEVMDRLINNASGTGHVASLKGFATEETSYTSTIKLYSLVQCTPDLSSLDCNRCLRWALADQMVGRQGGRLLYVSCTIRYETYRFYKNVTAAPPPTPPPSASASGGPGIGSGGNRGLSTAVIVAIVLSIIISIVLFTVVFCLIRIKVKKLQNVTNTTGVVDGSNISAAESLQYDLSNIKAATNNFSADNKIGEGGFGEVFKGTLDGKQIAVKRLSKTSGQGEEEFKNEVLVVAKLQHRNLVRLLGYCLDEDEKLLIYEYVQNKSLDFMLFGQEMQQSLDWSRRFKIINGVAKGILYLHEDSRLRIIHRDIKASNVLLDSDMNAKISDFGLARIIGFDKSEGSTNRVVGTFGYMSPEYIMHGQFSVKSDVFSFGVLMLEIISGKKNKSFYQSRDSEHLLSYAWLLWKEGKAFNLVDPAMRDSSNENEVTRCIHISLLCVQKNVDERPTMASVALMLNSSSMTLPIPHTPAFFIHDEMMSMPKHLPDSVLLSVNGVSFSDLYPR